jgi:hypothetical protein
MFSLDEILTELYRKTLECEERLRGNGHFPKGDAASGSRINQPDKKAPPGISGGA